MKDKASTQQADPDHTIQHEVIAKLDYLIERVNMLEQRDINMSQEIRDLTKEVDILIRDLDAYGRP